MAIVIVITFSIDYIFRLEAKKLKESSVNYKFKISYDSKMDILYMTFKKSDNAVCYEQNNVLIRFDQDDYSIVGITLMDCSKLKKADIGIDIQGKLNSRFIEYITAQLKEND